MPVSAETMAQVAELTRELLEARFGDDFIFGPILVMSKIDQYGDEYVEIKTVYDGDRKNLDPGWTAGLSRRTREALDELGVPGLPASFGFVKKSAGKPGRPRKPHEPVPLDTPTRRPTGGHAMTVSAETMNQVAELTRELLEAQFGDDFVFGPILVRSRIDQYGDEYVEIKTVYDGDMEKLDHGWTGGLSTRTWDALEAIGVPGLPAYFGFVEKSDWEAGPPK